MSRRASALVAALVGVVASSVLAGCSPVPVGFTAVSQRGGHLLIAVLRCDDTALERVTVDHSGPLRGDDLPREHPDDGRWTTDQDDDDIIVLDTSAPGAGWTTELPLDALDPQVHYSASGGGDADHPMGSVGFTAGDLENLEEGRWLFDTADDDTDHAVRPTTTDLADLREDKCDH